MTNTSRAVRSIIITVANTVPKENISAVATNLKILAANWVTIFQSSSANRTAVKNTALASSDPGDQVLGTILTALATVSDANRTTFITSFSQKAANMVTGLQRLSASGAAGTVTL